MKSSATQIAAWLRQQLDAQTPAGALATLELHHLPVGSKRSRAAELRSIAAAGIDADTAGAEFAGAAEAYADGLASGPQRFIVYAYRAARPAKIANRFAFIIAAPEDDDHELESEPPTRTGLQAQLMRHLEVQQRASWEMIGKMTAAVSRMVEQVSAENAQLRAKHLKSLELQETMLGLHQERELSAKESAAKLAALSDVQRLLLPAVVTRLTSGQVHVPSEDPVAIGARRLLEHLKEQPAEKRDRILALLDDKERIAVMELLRAINN